MSYYNNVRINGVGQYMAGIAYDTSGTNNIAKVMLFSFYTKQQHDQCLASIQKGISFNYKYDRIYTKTKGYESNLKKCYNDNLGDGYHAMIFSTDEDTIIVNKGEDKNELLYRYLLKFKSGILPEWKDYFIDMLTDLGYINKCIKFDNTDGAYMPDVYVMKDIDTTLIRNIKKEGLKNGSIILPVANDMPLDTNMEFIDIIEKLIIPYIQSEKCHYNVGDKIHPLIESPIKKGNKIVNLYPKQQIIAQGILNFIKDGNSTCIFNGGMRIGKTFTSIKTSLAILDEVLKKKDAYIGVYCQANIIKTWQREFIACLETLGIKPNIKIINKASELNSLSKKPKGINVLIFPKDRAKRSYSKAHSASYKHLSTTDIDKFIKKLGSSQEEIEVRKCNVLDRKKLKLAVAKYTKEHNKLILLYREIKTKGGNTFYKCVTNSKTLLNTFGDEKKWFNFTVQDLSLIHDAIKDNINEIQNEKIPASIKGYENYITCPSCGGKIYDNDTYLYKESARKKFIRNLYVKDSSGKYVKRSKTGRLAKCNNFIKADGSTLSDSELSNLILRENLI